jgi:hypothetical protein
MNKTLPQQNVVKQKKKNKIKLVLRYEKILTKPKKFVRQKIVTKKFGSSQTKNYYTQ